MMSNLIYCQLTTTLGKNKSNSPLQDQSLLLVTRYTVSASQISDEVAEGGNLELTNWETQDMILLRGSKLSSILARYFPLLHNHA